METIETPENLEIPDEGVRFGETELPFSRLEAHPGKIERRAGEGEEEFKQRIDEANERIFLAGMLAQETGGLEAAKEAFAQDDFRLKRMQRRQLYSAIADMGPAAYSARVNGMLQMFPEGSAIEDYACGIARSVWDKAVAQAEIDAINAEAEVDDDGATEARVPEPEARTARPETVAEPEEEARPEAPISRTRHDPERKFRTADGVDFETPYSYSAFRHEIDAKEKAIIERTSAKYYRAAKQERRSSNFFGKMKARIVEYSAKRKEEKEIKAAEKAERRREDVRSESERRFADLHARERDWVQGKYGRERPREGYFAEPLPEDFAGAERPRRGYFSSDEEERSRFEIDGRERPRRGYYEDYALPEDDGFGEPDDLSVDDDFYDYSTRRRKAS